MSSGAQEKPVRELLEALAAELLAQSAGDVRPSMDDVAYGWWKGIDEGYRRAGTHLKAILDAYPDF